MSTALFGNVSRPTSKNLVECKAGKMTRKGKMVHPDKRKGLLYLYQSDDSLMHFCWRDRSSGNIEEDLIIFPDDCEYKKIPACTTGRAYVLKFKSTSRRLFFWLQEPKTDKDDEFCRKINEYLNHPPSPGSHPPTTRSGTGSSSAGGSGSSASQAGSSVLSAGDLSNIRDSDLQNLLGNISQQQLMQILGSGVPNLSSLLTNSSSNNRSSSSTTSTTASTPTSSAPPSSTSSSTTPMDTSTSVAAAGGSSSTSTSSTSASKPPGSNKDIIKLEDLQSILTNIITKDGSSSPSPPVDLSSTLTWEALQPLLSNSSFVDQLTPFLPETSEKLPPAHQLKDTVNSPQFKQAVGLFSTALQSGQLAPVIRQFNLGEEAVVAAAAGDMEAFIKALTKSSKKKKEGEEDDSMAVD